VRSFSEIYKPLEPLRRGPMREGAFHSKLHQERIATFLGMALGVCFTICFITGLISHFIQRGPSWTQEAWPAHPVSFYRVTQGLHVLTGCVAVPLLIAKMWVAYPKLYEWPPVRDPLHGVERLGLVALVGGAIFQLVTGVLNIFYWYAFPFFFPSAHYAGAFIAIGGLIMHIGAKWEVARRALAAGPEPAVARTSGGLSRRAFLTVIGATSGAILATTIGSTTTVFSRFAILAPRRAGDGSQGLPVNGLPGAHVHKLANDPGYTFEVGGSVQTPLALDLASLEALPRTTVSLPISCVEGWSTMARWSGVRLVDLLDHVGADHGAQVRVESLQPGGLYRTSTLNPGHARSDLTLLALELNGERLNLDHGYPLRLIAPNRPGVEQTKWVKRIVIL
jgi:hypothetical protein